MSDFLKRSLYLLVLISVVYNMNPYSAIVLGFVLVKLFAWVLRSLGAKVVFPVIIILQKTYWYLKNYYIILYLPNDIVLHVVWCWFFRRTISISALGRNIPNILICTIRYVQEKLKLYSRYWYIYIQVICIRLSNLKTFEIGIPIFFPIL